MKAVFLGRLALLVLLLGAGVVPAAVARSKSGGKDPPSPPRDSVLRIPRVSQAPELDRLLEIKPTGGKSAKASKKKGGADAKGAETNGAETKGGEAKGADTQGTGETAEPKDPPGSLAEIMRALEARLRMTLPAGAVEPRKVTSEAAPRVDSIASPAPPVPAPMVIAPPAPGTREAVDTAPGDSARDLSTGRDSIAVPVPSKGGATPVPRTQTGTTRDAGGSRSWSRKQALEARSDDRQTRSTPPVAPAGPATGSTPQSPASRASTVRTRDGPASMELAVWTSIACAALPTLWVGVGWIASRGRRGSDRSKEDPLEDGGGEAARTRTRKARMDWEIMETTSKAKKNGHDPDRNIRPIPPPAAVEVKPKQGSHLRRMFVTNLLRVKGSLMLAALFMVAGAAVELVKPWPLKVILDHVIYTRPLPEWLAFLDRWTDGGTQLLLLCAGAIVAVSIVGGMFSYMEVFITKAIGYRMVYALRREVFAHLQRLSLSFHNRSRSGDLLTTFAKDTSTLKDIFAEALLKFADHFLSVIGMVVILWMINWRVAAIALATLPFLGFTLLHLYRQTKTSLKKQRKQEGKVTSRFNEVLAAVPLVQAFGRERHEQDRYEEVSNETLRESIRMTRLEAAASRSSHIMTSVGTAGTVLFGALEVLQGRMSPGDLVLVTAYLSNMYKPLRSLAKLSIEFSKASASAERIAEVLEVEPEIQDRPDAIDIKDLRGEVIFTAVSFDYGDDKEVLRHVSFEVRPGQKLALVGASGAGKSTIASLILRLYEAQQGAILIDGIAIERLRRESLRRQIGIVLQQSVLFGATIRENIAYGKPSATLEEIIQAARTANADEFIRDLEDGYDSVIGERGATLSAGQRQRIAIARAIVRNPRILILDEPMTGLDAENETKVREALDRLMEGKTTIMITHDLQHMADADQVLVLKDGRIAERGSHAELLARSGYYREVFDLGGPSSVHQLARA